MDALELGMFAALLQFAGYAFYGSKILSRDIRPNAASWLMFTYGTALLLVVEWDRNASFALLALPATCAVSSIFIALYALREKKAWWPEHRLERFSFGLDVVLTVAYGTLWLLLGADRIGEEQKNIAEIVILICWNIGIFTSFFPLLRQVYHHPRTEHFMPWLVWAFAYLFLALTTIIETGNIFTELLLYPLIQSAIHGFIAVHTGYWRHRHKLSLA